jgi:hypothetical protein
VWYEIEKHDNNTPYDFNELFLSTCLNYQKDKEFMLGKFSVVITEKTDRVYIDGIRINKKEVTEVLQKAICFDSKEDYLNLLKEISYCSIKIHNALCNGIIINYRSNLMEYREQIPIKIIIERNKNRHFILLQDEKIRVNNINDIFMLAYQNGYESRDFKFVSEHLKKSTAITDEQIPTLLKVGLSEYKLAIQRSEELLADTLKLLKIKKAKVTIDGDEENGYIVNGKMNTYFVTEQEKVYTYPKLQYICIIDRNKVATIDKDRLVSRLYALSNDSVLANDISTIPKHL